jgi:DNA-binding MarR family transcriptional regulator
VKITRDILNDCACNKVRTAARVVTRAYDDALRPVGLRATQLAVLVAVETIEALSITSLAAVLGMDRSTLTRNLRPLEDNGLVALGPEGWRRSRTLEITKKGQQRLREAVPLWEKAQKTLGAKLGDRNLSAVHHSLDSLIKTA